MSLLGRRLNIVTGKGGVGKSTVTAALALAAQARGMRVLCCEVTAKERVASLLGAPDCGPVVTQVDRSIWSVHIRPEEAMREYGLMVLRFKAIYGAVFENRLVRYVLRAMPSLPEIVMLGKVFWHVTEDKDEAGRPRWDVVLLDAPATGHGVTFLQTPKNFLDLLTDSGPMVRDMRNMQAMLTDPSLTAVSVVSLPEEMPANEAVELHQAVRGLGLPGGRLFLNGWVPPRFSEAERGALRRADEADLGAARLAAFTYGERQDLSAHYEARLRAEVDLPLVRLPMVPTERFDRPVLEALAAQLAEEV